MIYVIMILMICLKMVLNMIIFYLKYQKLIFKTPYIFDILLIYLSIYFLLSNYNTKYMTTEQYYQNHFTKDKYNKSIYCLLFVVKIFYLSIFVKQFGTLVKSIEIVFIKLFGLLVYFLILILIISFISYTRFTFQAMKTTTGDDTFQQFRYENRNYILELFNTFISVLNTPLGYVYYIQDPIFLKTDKTFDDIFYQS